MLQIYNWVHKSSFAPSKLGVTSWFFHAQATFNIGLSFVVALLIGITPGLIDME
jgi:hypothetical protein